MADWLQGLASRPIRGDIHEIQITGYGPADVGPYEELTRYVGKGSGLECHHIVEVEHLEIVSTRFTNENAPCVAITREMHRQLVSPRFTAEQGILGGRYGGRPRVSRSELLELYKQVYTWHTPFRELYSIARQILR